MESSSHIPKEEHLAAVRKCADCPLVRERLQEMDERQDGFRRKMVQALEEAEGLDEDAITAGEDMPGIDIEKAMEIVAEDHEIYMQSDCNRIGLLTENCQGPKRTVLYHSQLGERIILHCRSPRTAKTDSQD